MGFFNKLLKDTVDGHMPVENELIMHGLSGHMLKYKEEYIDASIREAAKTFPDCLKYKGISRPSLDEILNEVAGKLDDRGKLEISRSTLYLLKITFSYVTPEKKTKIERLIYAPYTLPNSSILLSGGNPYNILPIISDKVVSFENNSIFIKLLRDKNKFNRTIHQIYINGKRVITSVIYVTIYRSPRGSKKPSKSKKERAKVKTTVALYLLGKYGLDGFFEKYFNFKPIVINGAVPADKYPSSNYNVYSSIGEIPAGYVGGIYKRTNISFVINKDHVSDEQTAKAVENFIGSIFYIIDHLPSWFIFTSEISQLYLGKIILPEENSVAKVKERVGEHYNSLDNYVDIHSKKKLKSLGIDINDYYDLMFLVNKNFNEWTILNSKTIGLEMDQKIYEVLQYILYPITESVIRTTQELKKDEARGMLTEIKAQGTIRKFLKKGAIYDLNKQKIYAQLISYPGDHKYPAISSIAGLQQDADGDKVSTNKKKALGDKDKLNFSMIEAGSLFAIKKSNHNPIYTINPFININPMNMTMIPNPKFDELREEINNILHGSISANDIDVTECLEYDNDTDDIDDDDDTDDNEYDNSENNTED